MHVRHLLRALTLSLAAVVVLAALGVSPAHAVDMTSPGNQCSVISYSPSKSPDNAGYGSIGNASSTADLYVQCPLIAEPNNTPINWGVVAVINQWPAPNGLSCTLWSVNIPSSGTYTGWYDQQFAYTASPNQQYLSFGSLPGNDHYFYSCYIPYKNSGKISSVNAYRVNEK